MGPRVRRREIKGGCRPVRALATISKVKESTNVVVK